MKWLKELTDLFGVISSVHIVKCLICHNYYDIEDFDKHYGKHDFMYPKELIA